jgi:hypothetical protein
MSDERASHILSCILILLESASDDLSCNTKNKSVIRVLEVALERYQEIHTLWLFPYPRGL